MIGGRMTEKIHIAFVLYDLPFFLSTIFKPRTSLSRQKILFSNKYEILTFPNHLIVIGKYCRIQRNLLCYQ